MLPIKVNGNIEGIEFGVADPSYQKLTAIYEPRRSVRPFLPAPPSPFGDSFYEVQLVHGSLHHLLMHNPPRPLHKSNELPQLSSEENRIAMRLLSRASNGVTLSASVAEVKLILTAMASEVDARSVMREQLILPMAVRSRATGKSYTYNPDTSGFDIVTDQLKILASTIKDILS